MTDTIHRDDSMTGPFASLITPSVSETLLTPFDGWMKDESRSGRRSEEFEPFPLAKYERRPLVTRPGQYPQLVHRAKGGARSVTYLASVRDAPKVQDRSGLTTADAVPKVAGSAESQRDRNAALSAAALVLNRGYRAIWLVLAVLAMGWTWLSALSLLAGVGIPRAAAVLGLVAMLGLLVTTFVAGAPHRDKR